MEGPPERDVKDFEFRQLCKFRLFSAESESQSSKRVQKLATSSKFGVIFAASHNEIKIVLMDMLSGLDSGLGKERSTAMLDAPIFKQFTVTGLVVHLGVSSDGAMLSVVVDDENTVTLLIFDIHVFADQLSAPSPLLTYQIASGNVSLLDLAWNPGLSSLLALCLSNGSVSILDVTDTLKVVSTLPPGCDATCLSWSPKGKKLMVGKVKGSCAQYSHDLKEEKQWSAPGILTLPHDAIDVVWVSTHTFMVAYLPQGSSPDTQPVVILTESAKDGQTSCINFDDICFGSGDERRAKYYFTFLAQWEMIVVSSSNATETTIVARHLDQKLSWEHWTLEDSSRAELPVTDNQTDSFPLGMCVCLSSQQVLQLGDNKTHPACPVLLLLSTDGVLVPFHMVYFHSQAPSLIVTPQPLCAQNARKPLTGQPVQVSVVQTRSPLANLLMQPTSTAGGGPASQTTAAKPVTAFSFGQPSVASSFSAGGGLLGKSVSANSGGLSLFGTPSTQSGLLPVQSGAGKSVTASPGGLSLFGTTSSPFPSGFGNAKIDANQAELSVLPQLPQPSSVMTVRSGFVLGTASGSSQIQPAQTIVTSPNHTGAASSLPLFASLASDTVKEKFTLPKSGIAEVTDNTETSKPLAFATQSLTKSGSDAPVLPNQKSSAIPLQPSALAGLGAAAGGSKTGSGQFSFNFSPSPGGLEARPQQPASLLTSSSVTAGSGSFSLTFASNKSGADASGLSAVPIPAGKAGPTVSSQTAQGVLPTLTPAGKSGPAVSSQTAQGMLPPLTPVGRTGAAVRSQATKATSASVASSAVAAVQHGMLPAAEAAAGSGRTSAPALAASRHNDTDINDILNSTINKNIIEEIADFEREMRLLQEHRCQPFLIVGTKEEMDTLHQSVRDLANFCKEVHATTKEQSLEVHDLKTSCLDLFAMAEDCCLRQERHKDSRYIQAQQQRALDPASAKRLQNLHQLVQVIGQSLQEADSVLDAQWEDHVSKEKKTRIRVPNSNTIYRAIKSNHNIIVRQQSVVEQIQSQLRKQQLRSLSSQQSITGSAASITDIQPAHRDWRLRKQDLVTPEKVTLLREALSGHTVRKVKCAPLESLSMSRLVNTREEKRLFSTNSSIQAGDVELRDGASGRTLTCVSDSTLGDASIQSPRFSSTPALSLPATREPRSEETSTAFSGVAFFKPGNNISPTVPQSASTWTSPMGGTKLLSTQASLGLGSNNGAVFPPATKPVSGATMPVPTQVLLPVSSSASSQVQTVSRLQTSLMFSETSRLQTASVNSAATDPKKELQESATETELNDGETDDNDEYGYEEDDEEDEEEDEDDEEEAGFGDEYEYPQDVGSLTAASLVSAVLSPPTSNTAGILQKPPLAIATLASTANITSSSGHIFSKSVISMAGLTSAATTTPSSVFGSGTSLFSSNVPSFGALADAGEQPSALRPPLFSSAADTASALGTTTASSTVTADTSAVLFSSCGGQQAESSGTTKGLFAMPTNIVVSPSSESASLSTIADCVPSAALVSVSSSSLLGEKQASVSVSTPSVSVSTPSVSVSTPSVSVSTPSVSVSLSFETQDCASAIQELSSKPSFVPSTTSSSGTTQSETAGSAASSGFILGTSRCGATTSASSISGTSTQEQATSAASVFGAPASGTGTSMSSLFGISGAGQISSNTSIFGLSTSGPSSTNSVFGNSASEPASTGNVFGTSSGPTAPIGSIFGTSASGTSTSSVFGTPSAGNPTSSIFGTSGTAAPITGFETPSSGTVSSTTSIFRTPTSAAGSGSRPAFGDGASPTSIFGSTSATSPGGSIFGGATASAASSSGATFGFSQSTFGGFGKPAFGSGPSFGQSPSGFGQSGVSGFSQGTGSGFGSSTSVFGQPAVSKGDTTNSVSGLFGGSGGLFGLGAKPSEEKAKQNVFGGTQVFGTSSNNASLFGKQETTGFGSASTQATSGNLFQGTSFSAGSGGVAAMGFAVSQQTSSTEGFGPGPAFGNSPSFGSSPSFASAPAFGAGSNFGSSPSFSSSAGFSGGFGSTATASAGFGGFGSSSGVFGSLAQSSETPSFGTLSHTGAGGFGSLAGQTGTGAFGSQSPGFGGNQSGFGSTTFGSNPSFSAYRG